MYDCWRCAVSTICLWHFILLCVLQGGEGEVVRVYECWLEDARARNGADHPAIAAVLSAFAGLLVEQVGGREGRFKRGMTAFGLFLI